MWRRSSTRSGRLDMSDEPDNGRVPEDLLRAGAAWLETMARAAAERGGTGRNSGPDGSGLAAAVARAHLAILIAGLEFGRQVAEAQMRRGVRLREPLAAALRDQTLGEPDRQVLVEEARGYLREVSTIALAEARGLQRALADIDRALHAEAGGKQEQEPSRRWKAKD